MENNFKQIEKKYRPLPFWSWNEKLDTNETKRQIELMHEAGLGGFFMHARGGLQTEYMGKEWFENISLGINDAKKAGMQAWAYDENGWPSGFGNGLVNGLGVSYQQKYLRLQEGTGDTETTIINLDGYHLYYEINPFYVDTLDAKVTDAFIDAIYTKYYDIYKNETPGFFIDEPQVSRDGIPWSFIMPSEYKNRYGDELLPLLLQLFKPIGDYKKTRYNFWKMVTDLFSQNFTKRIYDWCDSHDMCFTGHMVLEEELLSQLTSNGAVMPNYEYFHIPGMDWLGRQIKPITTPLQVSSVAHQLGKKQILSETFALTGWNITFEEFKWLAEWQMVRGITLLCPHLEGYSLRGIRKRDYPPSIFYQQPWWKDYKDFVDYISRVGKILTEGSVKFDTLIIHPQSTAWLCYDDDKNEGIEYYNAEFIRDLETLEKAHCLFHIGDETLMERHCHVLGDTIVFGTQTYKTLVIPKHLVFSENTNNLISEFKKNGGNVVNATDVMPSKVIDNGEISMTVREFEDYKIYYFVNSTDKKQNTILNIDGYTEILNLNGETELFGRETYVFEPFESILILEYFKDKQLN
ncbi:MAG: hypothetical protein RR145_03150, partial [Oscillospiraceae bacterium]